MKKVILSVVCRNQEEAEETLHEMINSRCAQLGIYTIESAIYDCNEQEEKEVYSQVPSDIIER